MQGQSVNVLFFSGSVGLIELDIKWMGKWLAPFLKPSLLSVEINSLGRWFLRNCPVLSTLGALSRAVMPLFMDRAKCNAAESAFHTWIYRFYDNFWQFWNCLVWLSEVELSHSVISAVYTQPDQHLRQQALCIDQVHLLLTNCNADHKRKLNPVIPW